MIEVTIGPGDPILFKEENTRQLRGLRLSGNILHCARRKDSIFTLQHFETDSWMLNWRKYEFNEAINFFTHELNKWIRMEIVLAGELTIKQDNFKTISLQANQYHVTNSQYYQSHYTRKSDCDFLVVYVSTQYLQSMTNGKRFVPCKPKPLTLNMRTIVEDILECRYLETDVRDFYYGRIWDLLFYHFQGGPVDLPGGLSEREMAAIRSADFKIAEDFNAKMTTGELARMVAIPEHVLFKGFKEVFGMTPFERMMDRRMDLAAKLLAKTDLVVMDIALRAGYTSLSAFGSRFKRKFRMSPAAWRKFQKGG